MPTHLNVKHTYVTEHFFSLILQITDDSSLQIRRTIQFVESIILDTRDHMTFLTTQWESWQTHVSTSRQFKTQWHQFIQDARKVGAIYVVKDVELVIIMLLHLGLKKNQMVKMMIGNDCRC